MACPETVSTTKTTKYKFTGAAEFFCRSFVCNALVTSGIVECRIEKQYSDEGESI
jgi:hypothetical protein